MPSYHLLAHLGSYSGGKIGDNESLFTGPEFVSRNGDPPTVNARKEGRDDSRDLVNLNEVLIEPSCLLSLFSIVSFPR